MLARAVPDIYFFMSTTHIFVGALLALACLSDLRTRRIPNALTSSAAACGLLLHLITGGPTAAAWSLGGRLVGAALFLPMLRSAAWAGGREAARCRRRRPRPGQVAVVALATSIAGGALGPAVAI